MASEPLDATCAPVPNESLRVLVFSSLFPSAATPTAGTFIRERMFRVAQRAPVVVVAPQPWSPFDGLIRNLFKRPDFRPVAAEYEVMDGVPVYRPRYLSMPGLLKRLDGRMMARGSRKTVDRLVREFRPTLIDAHFLYPTGFAASLLAVQTQLPMTVTVRGSADEWLLGTDREPMLREAMKRAARVICVSQALLRSVVLPSGIPTERVTVVGNGVDLAKFERIDRLAARARLGIDADAQVLIGVGHLVDGKGFHRVIPLLPQLRKRYPKLLYLVVGGGREEAAMRPRLERLAAETGVADIVRFCGAQPQAELKWYYSAADVFTLATAFEGWANVFLEAMACGLPVVTTRVGGNAEVVRTPDTGTLVEYWDAPAFGRALHEALQRDWDRNAIVDYARANTWDERIDRLMHELCSAVAHGTHA